MAEARRDSRRPGAEQPPYAPQPGPTAAARRWFVPELVLVFLLSLGASALTALVSLVASLAARGRLSQQSTLLVGSLAPHQPWLDLVRQLLSIFLTLIPVALAAHFLTRSGESLKRIGFDRTRPWSDALLGAVLAAVVGGTGLLLYLGARAAGANLTVVPTNLPPVWWRYPVLVLYAVMNGLLEEVLVAGYLLHRLRQLGLGENKALAISATLRGSYHLYQGFGGFIGNLAMGLLFGRIWQRTNRTTALVIAHSLIDTVAFVGYALLAGHVSWLPT